MGASDGRVAGHRTGAPGHHARPGNSPVESFYFRAQVRRRFRVSGGPLWHGLFLTDPTLPAGHCNSAANQYFSRVFAQDGSGNWIIPANRVNQNALSLLNALVPLPNDLTNGTYSSTSSATDYLNTSPNITSQVDVLGKVDHDISSRFRLMGEYMLEEQTFSGANAARFGAPWSTNYDIFETDDQAGQLRLMQILSPTMTNQTGLATGIFDGTHDFAGIKDILSDT